MTPTDPNKILSYFHSSPVFSSVIVHFGQNSGENPIILSLYLLIDFLPYYPQSLRHGATLSLPLFDWAIVTSVGFKGHSK